MSNFAELASTIWNYKFSITPVIVTYFLFEIPALVRKLTRIAYVPIYFIFFPSGHSDRLYAQYFNEDWIYGDGEHLTQEERARLRYRIQATAVISMIFATIIAPWFCGFFSALYLSTSQFAQFIWFLIIVKAVLIINVLFRLRAESPAASQGKAFYYVLMLYAAYIFFVWRGLTKAFEWTHSNLETKGFFGLALGFFDYAYIDIFINIIIVGAGTWALTFQFTNPAHVRQP